MIDPHTFYLIATTPDASRKDRLYLANCSCGWNVAKPVAAMTGRALHAEHLNQVSYREAK